MHLKIVHTTGYEYDDVVVASYNEARLTPLTERGQLVTQTRVDVQPKPWTHSYRDHWGTQVTAFEVLDPHRSLTVTGTSIVHTRQTPPPNTSLSWAELAASADEFAEYLMLRDRVRPPPDLQERADALRAQSSRPMEAAYGVCDLIHREVEYLPGATEVHALASEAWEQRSGVCQDIAHLVIGCLRSLGIPARYVSGYLHPRDEPVIGETVEGESHAWIEWWDGEWRGFDPTNQVVPGERHVIVATGRNYDDVRPLGGIYSGPGNTSRMFVRVEVTRLP